MVDIGMEIRKKVMEKGETVVWFARQMSCSRNNVYRIFGKRSIDTNELRRISTILNFDFFSLYSKEIAIDDKSEAEKSLL